MTGSLNMTPDENTTRRLERSQRPGSASRARSIGLANASPTMAIEPTPSRSIVSSNSTTSKWRALRDTTEPPIESIIIALKDPVPCMSGQAGTKTGAGFVTASRTAAKDGSGP